MRKYSQELVNSCLNNIKQGLAFDININLVPIPDLSKDGVLDPREEEVTRNLAHHSGSIADLRKHNGYPNENINSEDIESDVIYLSNKTPLFVYQNKRDLDKLKPAVLYVHGGAWLAGSAKMHENTCKFIAELFNAKVFNLDYSLAPENPYPCSLNESKEAIRYIYDNAAKLGVDNNRIITSGDSSGANLVLCAIQSDIYHMVKAQILYYPCVTFYIEDTPFKWDIKEYQIAGEQFKLINSRLGLGRNDNKGSIEMMKVTGMIYLRHNEDRLSPTISPLYGDIKKNPKTIMFTAEYDGLRIQDEYFSSLLAKHGVDVITYRFKGLTHAYMDKMGVFPQAEASLILAKENLVKWGIL